MMVVLWVTEALPLAVTALIGPVLAVVLRVAPARTALRAVCRSRSSFSSSAASCSPRRCSSTAWTGASPSARCRRGWSAAAPTRILFVYGAVPPAISMWISNTATTAMMFPIGLSIVAHLTKGRESEPGSREFAMAMMLMAAFGASIGGIGTPIGTPPNLIGIGMLERHRAASKISFFQWMLLGVPACCCSSASWSRTSTSRSLRGLTLDAGSAEIVREELRRLGPMSAGAAQRAHRLWRHRVALAAARASWPSRAPATPRSRAAYAAAVPESVAAMIGAILLFLLPGKLAGAAVHADAGRKPSGSTGESCCCSAAAWPWASWRSRPAWPRRWARGITSWLPVAVADGADGAVHGRCDRDVRSRVQHRVGEHDRARLRSPCRRRPASAPLQPALGATLGASMGFMMPISTPPNAIVYSSGYVPITTMMRHGIALDVAGFIVIVVMVGALGFLF